MSRGASTALSILAALFVFVGSTRGYGQTLPEPTSNDARGKPSPKSGVVTLTAQLTSAVGNASGTSNQSGVTTIAHIDPQPSGAFCQAVATLEVRRVAAGVWAVHHQLAAAVHAAAVVVVRWGRWHGSGNGSGLGGPPSANTIPCGTPQWQCFTTPGGSTYFGVPATSFQGILPFTPAGPWIPTGPVTRLNPVAKAHDLVNHMAWPDVTIGINPNPGVVAIKSWFWIQNYAGQVLTNSGTISETHQECRTVSFPGANPGDPPGRGLECHDVTNTMTVDARVGPANYQWTFGDGRAGSQLDYPNPAGLGRAYTDPHTASPVAWSYEFSSLGHPDGFPSVWRSHSCPSSEPTAVLGRASTLSRRRTPATTSSSRSSRSASRAARKDNPK